MKQENWKILCIDDDDDTCELIKFVFEQKQFKVTTCGTAAKGLRLFHENNFRAVILDNRLEKTNGVEVCKEIRKFNTVIPIIFSSADARKRTREKAIKAGANAYFIKPNDFDELILTTTELIERSLVKSLNA